MKYGVYLKNFLSNYEEEVLEELQQNGLELKDKNGQIKTVYEVLKEMSERYFLCENENLKIINNHI